MKLSKYIFIVAVVTFVSCSDFLDVKPVDRITEENVEASIDGMTAYLADLYYNTPIEDFNYSPDDGFNFNGNDANNNACYDQVLNDDGIGSQRQEIIQNHYFKWWEDRPSTDRNRGFDRGAWKVNRDVNIFMSMINDAKITDKEKTALRGEAYFIRAYIYFALVKRYGGVPIITNLADVSNVESLFVPRSTEKETWDFVMATCDSAYMFLEEDDRSLNGRRATKWAALALKSRAALHAASVAKYWDRAPLSGTAVDLGLAKMDASEANRYYDLCITASKKIIEEGPFSLYQPNPADAAAAEKNYADMFEDPNKALSTEVIFMRGYAMPGKGTGTNIDAWANPNQTAGGWPHPGRFCPSLELADVYEVYSDPGKAAPIKTTTDGLTGDANDNGYDASRGYLQFDNPTELFKDKDARLKAATIIPSSYFKNTQIIIQGGYIKPDGALVKELFDTIRVSGKLHSTFGGITSKSYSGFSSEGGNYTRTGFGFRKFLRTDYTPPAGGWNNGYNDWIDMRLAEVLLNYAEAVVESNATAEYTGALDAINTIRRRAAFTGNGLYSSPSELTLENVLRERRVELVFENFRSWDLIRRREFHTIFNNAYRHALVPILDLRGPAPKYIFIRQRVTNTPPQTFYTHWYYKGIPGTGSNRLVQNPQQ